MASLHNRGTCALPVSARLNKFLALERREQRWLIKSWFLLGWFRAALLLVSFKRLSASLEHHPERQGAAELSPTQLNEAMLIGKLVSQAATATPWKSPCLTQVLVAQKLLAQRGIPGQFYLGVKRGCEGEDGASKLSAHAWVQCGKAVVNGAAGHQRFTVISTFSWGALP